MSGRNEAERMASLRRTLELEASALAAVRERIDGRFAEAVQRIASCKGRLVCSGIGKAGHVARKVAATFSSLGTAAFFVHPAEAAHGDLGMFTGSDIALLLSNSGESLEVNALLPALKAMGATVIALTGNPESTMAKAADLVLAYGGLTEACRMGLAPTTSTTVLLALGDALAVAVMEERPDFKESEYAFFHPAGALGKKLLLVKDLMQTGEAMVVLPDTAAVRDVILGITRARAGVAILLGPDGRLSGVFSDGDLRRSLERDRDLLEKPVGAFMTRSPKTIGPAPFAFEALKTMKTHRIGDLPVVDTDHRPVGILSLKDLVGIGLTS